MIKIRKARFVNSVPTLDQTRR